MSRWFFDQVLKRNLIYNQCWEDPSVDHEALNLGPADRIVMITSAGCNALDYLLRRPERIDCVDMNPHQTALIELKLAALRHLNYEKFFSMFGAGRIRDHREIYRRVLRPQLSPRSRRCWDKRIDYFNPDGPGLYYHGAAGTFARVLKIYVDLRPKLRRDLSSLERITSIEEQAAFYRREIAPALWTAPLRWLLRRPQVLAMLGVPDEQVAQMKATGIGDLSAFLESRVERVFTTLPMAQNYFWRVYIDGHYTPDCCPNYLKAEHFDALRSLSDRIHLHTMPLTQFLQFQDASFSVFVLLDHMDWLTTQPQVLQEEWKWIMRRSENGARIVYRSGGNTFDHVPAFAKQQLHFESELTSRLSERDRVGTYGSFYMARVVA